MTADHGGPPDGRAWNVIVMAGRALFIVLIAAGLWATGDPVVIAATALLASMSVFGLLIE